MIEVFLVSFGIAVGLNIIMFIPAFIFKTDKLTDISYGVSFALVAIIPATKLDRSSLSVDRRSHPSSLSSSVDVVIGQRRGLSWVVRREAKANQTQRENNANAKRKQSA